MADMALFLGALLIVYVVPGPDMILLLETGALRGRGQALALAVGLALARAAHVTLAALGLAALFKTHPWAFDAARTVGGIAVGSRERVVLLEIGEHWLVVGVAPGSVTGIATLPRGEISPAGTDAKPVTADFGALLAKLKAGRS